MADVTTISRVLWTTIIALHTVFAIIAYIKITQSESLNLPVPTIVLALAGIVPVLPILAILIPAVASAIRSRVKNTDVGPALTTNRGRALTEDDGEAPHRITPLARPVIAILSLFDVSLIASAIATLNPLTLDCGLAAKWQLLFSAKNVIAIRTIEETLHCCGFRNPHDQAFPFPDRNHGVDACLNAFGWDRACQPLLRAQERQTLSVFIGVGVFALAVKAMLTLFTTRAAGVRGDGRPVWSEGLKRGKMKALPGGGGQEEAAEGPSASGERYRDYEER